MVKQAFPTGRSWTRKAGWCACRERRGSVSCVHILREPGGFEAELQSRGQPGAHTTRHGKLDERMLGGRSSFGVSACYMLGRTVTPFA